MRGEKRDAEHTKRTLIAAVIAVRMTYAESSNGFADVELRVLRFPAFPAAHQVLCVL